MAEAAKSTTGPPVRSQPLNHKVAEAIRRMILIGQLVPGEIVTQDPLRYGFESHRPHHRPDRSVT
jgi:DNA-binding GntR family transcriptional regulator